MKSDGLNRYSQLRSELEELRMDFLGAASICPPVYHQLLTPLAAERAVGEAAWASFIRANEGSQCALGESEAWDVFPDGDACSRYHWRGDGQGIEVFRSLATTGYQILETIRNEYEDGTIELPKDARLNLLPHGGKAKWRPTKQHFGWVWLLNETGLACQTKWLQTDGERLWAAEAMSNDLINRIETPAYGGAPHYAHPLVESLRGDVFRASADAIGVLLQLDDVVLIDERDAIPVLLPLVEGHIHERRKSQGTAFRVPLQGSMQVASPMNINRQGDISPQDDQVDSEDAELDGVDEDALEFRWRGKSVAFGKRFRNTQAFRMFKYLWERRNKFVTHNDLQDAIWGEEPHLLPNSGLQDSTGKKHKLISQDSLYQEATKIKKALIAAQITDIELESDNQQYRLRVNDND